jgi:hypothetical protein
MSWFGKAPVHCGHGRIIMATATALGDHWGIPLNTMTPRARSSSNRLRQWLACLLGMLALATLAQAHDIPADVRVQAQATWTFQRLMPLCAWRPSCGLLTI